MNSATSATRVQRLVGVMVIVGLLLAVGVQPASAQPAHPQGAAAIYLPAVMGGAGQNYARIFPMELAVASPLRIAAAGAAGSTGAASVLGSWTTGYAIATGEIHAVVTGATSVAEVFEPAALLRAGSDAACYGPTLRYQHHPDGGGGASSELPHGDLGLWDETDATGDACAAAQLNARLNGAEAQSQAALNLVGGMVAAAAAAGLTLPTGGGTLDVTAALAAAGIPDVSITSATITYDATTGAWRHSAAYVYTDPADGSVHVSAVEMSYRPDASTPETRYTGVLFYRANDEYPWGNCPAGGSGGRPVTMSGTLAFARYGDAAMRIQQRTAAYCGHDVDARDGGILDPELDWGDNYTSFTGNFDPESLAGDYAIAWQAGVHDRATRVLDLGINNHSPLDGEAYFGYGSRVQDDGDGVIVANGIFCNWAAPGSLSTPQPYAQRQFLRFNSTSGHFDVPTGGSDIRYAPTNSCQYDGDGAFWYDRNLNTAVDETADDLVVTPTSAYPFDLLAAVDGDADGVATIAEAIAARGYDEPLAP